MNLSLSTILLQSSNFRALCSFYVHLKRLNGIMHQKLSRLLQQANLSLMEDAHGQTIQRGLDWTNF